MKFSSLALAATIACSALAVTGCDYAPSADQIQADEQEVIIKDLTAQTGMPNIVNARERRLLKMIYELRDQDNFMTRTYMVSNTGGLRLLCQSMGFPISDATGYTNPDKLIRTSAGPITMTQAEPNGLYTPDFSNANWVMCMDEAAGKPVPTFVSGALVVSPVKFAE